MKLRIAIFTTFCVLTIGFGQGSLVSSKELNREAIEEIFTDRLKDELKIEYPVYRVYEYHDSGGKHFIIMTENEYECEEMQESFNSINAYCYSYKNGRYDLKWNLKDYILPDGNGVSEEYSISFWTKYFELDDYDGDGAVDPILVYGTYGMNGTDDGRIKILVYHKGKKRGIRHQNGTLDFERNTQVDKLYYELPAGIRNRVEVIMGDIIENNHGIFPYGWEVAMSNKKLSFDEN